ncbi:MAG: sodium-translocating pyrophosphatase [Candidatus Anstonellales archaeon]
MLDVMPILVAIVAVLMALGMYVQIAKLPAGNKKMQEIANAIREGAMAYLGRQNKTVGAFMFIIFVIFALIGYFINSLWYGIAVAFLVGGVSSALAGYIGMSITTLANVRTAEAAKKGLNPALGVSFRAGLVMGLAVVGLALFGITSLLYLFTFYIHSLDELMLMIAGMGFGASLIAMFARVGGGIYTKGADVGADLVGKVEKGIPEDDPRNPAVIADNVGDNVGDCAGMGADLFESYIVTIIATMILGSLIFRSLAGVFYPLLIASAAIVATIIGAFFVRVKENEDPMNGLYKGIYATAVLSAIGFYFITPLVLPPSVNPFNIFLTALIGLAVAIAIVKITDYFTAYRFPPVKFIAKSSETGAGTTLISGIAVGMESVAPYGITIILAIILSYWLAGIYGVTIAAMSMLSLSGIILAVDSFGPVSDNAGGIAEMSGLPSSVRKITDRLDAVGNTTKATTKGFAIASAGLAALALVLAFAQEVNVAASKLGVEGLPTVNGLPMINIMRADVLVGAFIGGVLPFLFSSYAIRGVGVSADAIIREVRRQFKDKRIMKGTVKPNYAACVDISTKAAISQLYKLGALAVLTPLIVGFVLGPAAVGGFLVGALIVGQFLAVFMCTGGAAWDNAKKYIETGKFGGKGSDAHKAAVVGDTVGDPFKDTAGPSLNPLIKILNTLSILFVSLFVMYALYLI